MGMVDRRGFLKGMGASVAGFALAERGLMEGVAGGAAVSGDVSRPHVLLIHTDQHRLDCLGANGNREVKTPNIDSIAADGVRFTNSFCAFPVCTPSRYSLMSGLPVHEHCGWNNHCTLRSGTPTFASVLREAGYATKAVGKMHFTPTYLDVGFEEMELAEQDGPGRWDDDYHRYLRDRGLVDVNDLEDQRSEYRKGAGRAYWESCGAMASNLEEKHHSTTWIGDRAVEAIEKWDESSPALLMAGFVKPHHPFDPPESWSGLYDPGSTSVLPGWIPENLASDLALSAGHFPHKDLTEAVVRRCTAFYYALITQIDYQVGRMIRMLKSRGLYERTLIVFTSDHGEYMGFHHMLLKGNHMYDPLAKVPLIVKMPGRGVGAGSVNESLVNTIDVAPTILKGVGLPVPVAMKGRDVLSGASSREVVFCETRRHVMARTRERKLIYDSEVPARSLYFDLVRDPLEMRNLFSEGGREGEIASLVGEVERWRPGKLAAVYVDENARRINGANVPPLGTAHRDEISAWYARKMQERRAATRPSR